MHAPLSDAGSPSSAWLGQAEHAGLPFPFLGQAKETHAMLVLQASYLALFSVTCLLGFPQVVFCIP